MEGQRHAAHQHTSYSASRMMDGRGTQATQLACLACLGSIVCCFRVVCSEICRILETGQSLDPLLRLPVSSILGPCLALAR